MSIYYLFPGLHGIDSWYHIGLIQEILKFGYLPGNELYSSLPVMHLGITIFKLLTGMGLKDSFFIVSVIEIIITLFIFIISSKIFNVEIGLLSTLILNMSDQYILWGVDLTPMTLGAAFFIILLYLIISKTNIPNKSNASISLLLILILFINTLTHVISNLVCVIALSIAFIVEYFVRSFNNHVENRSYYAVSINLAISSILLTISYWIYADKGLGYYPNYFDEALASLIYATRTVNIGNINLVTQVSQLDQYNIAINHIGYLIIIFLLIFGISNLISLNKLNNLNLEFLLVLIGAIFIIIYPSALIGLNALLPQRWFLFLYILIVIISAFGMSYLTHALGDHSAYKLAFISSFIFILIFSMITNSTTNSDSPIYPGNNIENSSYSRTWFFESEMVVGNFASQKIGSIHAVSDTLYTLDLFNKWYLDNNISPFLASDLDSFDKGLVIIRTDVLNGRVIAKSTNYMYIYINPPQKFLDYFGKTNVSLIYNNKKVAIYANRI
ncbi:MAG: hypothetical protein ABR985_22695 [Methanotrichaceae archaeon]